MATSKTTPAATTATAAIHENFLLQSGHIFRMTQNAKPMASPTIASATPIIINTARIQSIKTLMSVSIIQYPLS